MLFLLPIPAVASEKLHVNVTYSDLKFEDARTPFSDMKAIRRDLLSITLSMDDYYKVLSKDRSIKGSLSLKARINGNAIDSLAVIREDLHDSEMVAIALRKMTQHTFSQTIESHTFAVTLNFSPHPHTVYLVTPPGGIEESGGDPADMRTIMVIFGLLATCSTMILAAFRNNSR
jgi:hypothetical protein